MPQIDNPQRSLLAPLAPQANRVLGFMGVLVGLATIAVAVYQLRLAGAEHAVETTVVAAQAATEMVEEPWGNSTRERERFLVHLWVKDGGTGMSEPQPPADVTVEGFQSLESAQQYASENMDQPITLYVDDRETPARYRVSRSVGPLSNAILAGGVIVSVYGLLLLLTNRTIQQHAGAE